MGARQDELVANRPMIKTIESVAGFCALREEWDELLEASASNSFFLTWEWLYPWWKHLSGDRKLCIITVRSDGELIAIAPLASRRRRLARLAPFRVVEFLGADRLASDYLDLIIKRGREAEALHALGDYLDREMTVLEMANLRRDSCAAASLTRKLQQQGWSPYEEATGMCPFISLSGHSWESYLASLGSEHRYNFRRRLKNLTKASDVRFEQASSPAQVRATLSWLVTLHNLRWQNHGHSDAFHRSDLLAFHEEVSRLALDRGWLRLFLMTIDGHPAASLYGFYYRRTFYFVQSGFDPAFQKQSVGLLAMGLAIKSAIGEGAEEYDMLRGDEPYKFHWAREKRGLVRVELYPPRLSALLYRRAQCVGRAARTLMRGTFPRTLTQRTATALRG
jgi:CelD/BcsL family acetyltransferase involved in cellulose biosynthesis